MPRNSSSPSCFIFTYTVYTHTDGLSGSRCEDAALISFPSLCLICSPLPLLAGPSEIAPPLHTPSIHKVRWAEFITSHWGEMQSGKIYLLFFFFLQMISNRGKGSLSSVKLLIIRVFLVSAWWQRDALREEQLRREKEWEGVWLSMCSPSLPLFCHQLLQTILPRQIACPPPLMKADTEIVSGPHKALPPG